MTNDDTPKSAGKTIEELRGAAIELEGRLKRELDEFLKANGVPVGNVNVEMVGYQNLASHRPIVLGHKVSVRLDTGL